MSYDKLILSQGAKPIVPPIAGADLPNVFTLRDVPDMDRIVAFLERQRPKTAAVIGGGFIGLEMAEAFHRRGIQVTIIEKFSHILPLLDDDMAAYLQNQVRADGFVLRTGAEARALTAEGHRTGGRRVHPRGIDSSQRGREGRDRSRQGSRNRNRGHRGCEDQRPAGIVGS